MINPKELFRFNATREKKPSTVRGKTPIDTYPPTVEPSIVSNRIIAPTKERELAPPPTPEEIKAANKGDLAPRGITKKVLELAKRHPVATSGAAVAAVVTGFAAVEAAQGNIPGVHRAVENTSFDNKAENPKFTDKNTSYVTLEQFKTMDAKSTYDPDTQTFTYVPPFVLPEGVTVDYKKEGSLTSGPTVPFFHEDWRFIDRDGKPAAGVGIMVAEDGWHTAVFKGDPNLGHDPNFAVGVTLIKYFPEWDVTARVGFLTESTLQPNVPMIDFKEWRNLGSKGIFKDSSKLDELLSPQKGTILANTTSATGRISQEISIYKGKVLGTELVKDANPKLLEQIAGRVLLVKSK